MTRTLPKFKNQYEVDAHNLLEHYKKLEPIKKRSVQQQVKDGFQYEAQGNRNPIVHLIAWNVLTKTWGCEYLILDRKQSVVAPVNLYIYKAWLKAIATLETLRMQGRIDDFVYSNGKGGSLTLERGNIQIDKDDLPESKLTVAGVSDWQGTSYKNIRQGSYMGRR